MNSAFGIALAIGFFALSSPAQAAPPPSCAARLQAAGVNPDRLTPGDRGRLDGYEFIVAKDDSAARVCARVDADKLKLEGLRSQLDSANSELLRAQNAVDHLKSGGPIKEDYLVVEGSLLIWAVIATIWASYFAGRLNGRSRHSF